MPETKTEVRLPLGRLTIRPEALAGIVGKTVEQMEGVKLWHPTGLMRVFGGEAGVQLISPEPGTIDINVKIAVMFGYPLHEVAQGVQQAVREALEGLAGVRVREVNVYVQEVVVPEIEMEGGENGAA